MKTQFTPGPWKVGHTCGLHVASEVNGHTDVAWLGYWTSRECMQKLTADEQQANAALIAAAPDLLAAVEHVLIASEDGGDMNDIDWNMLRQAINKALIV